MSHLRSFLAVAWLAFVITPAAQAAELLLLDFGIRTGEAEGWDIIDEIIADEECAFQDDAVPCTIFSLTDRAGSDDDVTLEILEQPFIGNTAPHLGEAQVYDGFGVPVSALGDYAYRDPDTAGSSAPFRFSNIDPGVYRVTVFEGRTNDGNGQFAKLWVGDVDGSNEPGEPGEHEGKNTQDFAAGADTLLLEIEEGDFLWYRHLEDNSGGISGMIIRSEGGGAIPVEGSGTIGSSVVSGSRQNQVFGEGGELVKGLGQSWYAVGNPASKAGVDDLIASNDRAVPYFQAEDTSWWTGSSDEIDGVPKYPAQIRPGDPPAFEGDNVDNYTVKLEGQIKIEESGTIRFLDGVDDYTYLAIDVDRSGTAGDSDGEVLIDDNNWTNVLSKANAGAPIVEVTIDDVADSGEWLEMVFIAAEGGGGDSGVLYWDALDEDGFFPAEKGEGIFDVFDAEDLLVPDSHLQSPSTPPPLLSGDFVGAVPDSPTGWEIDVNPEDGTADAFALENPDANIYTTVLDVDGAVFHINALGENGASFKIFLADSITGTPTIEPEGWKFDAASGSVIFGDVVVVVGDCNGDGKLDATDLSCVATIGERDAVLDAIGSLPGDLDGKNGVNFDDFLELAANFGGEGSYSEGNVDLMNDINFDDFLELAANFGQGGGAAAAAVPEPAAGMLLGFGGLVLGMVRRRRR